jgi:uncharacterized protein
MHDTRFTILSLHITPKSAKSEILGWVADAEGKPVLKVKIAAPPEDGKANDELIRFLAKSWNIPKSTITLAAGAASRHKKLEIHADISRHLPFGGVVTKT